MITITQQARNSLRLLLDRIEGSVGLRLVISGEVAGAYMPSLIPIKEDEIFPDDVIEECQDLRVYMNKDNSEKAQGLEIDLVSTPYGPRLNFNFPPPEWDDPLAKKLQRLIDRMINPALQGHGGFVAIQEVKNGTAEIVMGGGCQGCAQSAQTLSQGVEAIIKRQIPEIHTVIDRTNHSGGTNPYYKPPTETGKSPNARRRPKRGRR